MEHNSEKAWNTYRETELKALLPVLTSLLITLDEEQPHIGGERYLMHAVTTVSGKKLILRGTYKGARVVIKATRDMSGMREIEYERRCRAFLKKIRFAYDVFNSPEEVLHGEYGGFLISVQKFIEQDTTFLERPIEAQFALALSAFKAQESAHATTYEHGHSIQRVFGSMDSRQYLRTFTSFIDCIHAHEETRRLRPLLERAYKTLSENQKVIEQYCGFLTHTDFVPHNFRIVGSDIYLLDHSSLRFGNKYEGWARFMNFMTLYNRELEQALDTYVRENRTPEESASLHLMRIYRLGEILCYYARTLPKSSDNLRALNKARIEFWAQLLESLLSGIPLSDACITEYKKLRDTLRSDEEKKRQYRLH